MSNTNKQLPKLNDLWVHSVETFEYNTEPALLKEDVETYIKEVVKYTLKQATEKARLKDGPNSYTGNTGSEYPADLIVDEQSILSLESQIIKDFGL